MVIDGRRSVAISGASGFIGSALAESLRGDGHVVRPLVRGKVDEAAGDIGWDPKEGRIDAAALEGIDAVVHLAGESLDARWTAEKKRRILDSRTSGTRLIADTLASSPSPPEVLVSVSAVGFYGMNRSDERLNEASGPGTDFLSRVVVAWEAAAEPAAEAGIRVVHPRFGVVLDRDGGALGRMLPVFQLGVGGRLGSGKQWMSWVSREDVIRAIRFLIDNPGLRGPVNVAAPEPVTNATFTEALGRALRRPTFMVVPETALRIVFGEMADAALLVSLRVFPERLIEAGFTFRHPTIDQAFGAIIRSET